MANDKLIEIEDLTKIFYTDEVETHALSGIHLTISRGEYVAIFDADFIPEADFLRRTIPYFQDKGIGMVQTRWTYLNRDYSLLTQVETILLDGHFVVEHGARSRRGRCGTTR